MTSAKLERQLQQAYEADVRAGAEQARRYVLERRDRICQQWRDGHTTALMLWVAYLRYTLTSYQNIDDAEALYWAHCRYAGKIK